MQPGPARADARTVIRLLAIAVAAAFLLSGCSGEEGTRAQELLQQAEQAQSKLDSATFEAKLRFAIDGKQVDVAMTGAASKEGAAFSVRTTGIPEAAGKDVRGRRPRQARLDERGQRSLDVDGDPEPDERDERLDGRGGVPGARALHP